MDLLVCWAYSIVIKTLRWSLFEIICCLMYDVSNKELKKHQLVKVYYFVIKIMLRYPLFDVYVETTLIFGS